jgi:hypothetical protein
MSTDAVVPFGTPVPAGVLSPEAALQFIADSRMNRDADDQVNICWPEYGDSQVALTELRRFAEYHGDRPPVFELINRLGRRMIGLWPMNYRQIGDLDIVTCSVTSSPEGPPAIELRFRQMVHPDIAFRYLP